MLQLFHIMKKSDVIAQNKFKFLWLSGVILVVFVAMVIGLKLFLTSKSTSLSLPTLSEAKQELHSVENELKTFIPHETITQTYPQTQTSKTLFDCKERAGENTYYWPGSERIDIKQDTNSGEIIGRMYDAWSSKPDWTASWRINDPNQNQFHLDLMRKDGLHIGVMNLDNNTSLSILGFTRCFELSNYNPNVEY